MTRLIRDVCLPLRLRLTLTLTLNLALTLALILGVTSCETPPQAPSDIENLLGYLFEHMDDDDPQALIIGLENLHAELQDDEQLQRVREGFTIETLPAEAVESLDDRERSASGLQGIAVATKSPHCSRALAGLLTWEDFEQLLDNFDFYNRTFSQDPTCFGDRECSRVEATSHTKSAWARIVEMESRYVIQYRWVETQFGWMMLQRFWLLDPVDGDKFDVKMNANYYIGIIMDDGGRAAAPVSPAFRNAANGNVAQSGRDIDAAQEALASAGSLRVHANWFNVDTGVVPLPETAIINTLITSQVNDSTRHDEWLDTHPDMVDCPQAQPEPSEDEGGAEGGAEGGDEGGDEGGAEGDKGADQ